PVVLTASTFDGTAPVAVAMLTVAVEQPIAVTTLAPTGGGPTECTLADAIQAANSNAAVNACRAGSPGIDIITLPPGTVTLAAVGQSANGVPTGLPLVTSDIILRGAGKDQTVVERGEEAEAFWLARVSNGGHLQLEDLTWQGNGSSGGVWVD